MKENSKTVHAPRSASFGQGDGHGMTSDTPIYEEIVRIWLQAGREVPRSTWLDARQQVA
ncbi:hypothetical protein ACN6AT_35815 (plasmid) [Streptomyces sp. JL4002]|uniref:hypothetical protein n=1 Tax=Streptomyces sp. JL4002 TaxID=3404781 RepID=UPI003B27C2AB